MSKNKYIVTPNDDRNDYQVEVKEEGEYEKWDVYKVGLEQFKVLKVL